MSMTFLRLLTQTAWLAKAKGRPNDPYSEMEFEDPVEIRVAYSNQTARFQDVDGEVRTSSRVIMTDAQVDMEDRLWIPQSAAQKRTPKPKSTRDSVQPLSVKSETSRRRGMTLYQVFFQ